MKTDFVLALAGGALIGLAAVLLLWTHGRIAGISGILGGALRGMPGDFGWRIAFLAGLLTGAAWVRVAPMRFDTQGLPSWTTLTVAGLLVGFGTRLGNGCTSGHGVCGIGRGSVRSIAATLMFMSTGALTVFIARHVL